MSIVVSSKLSSSYSTRGQQHNSIVDQLELQKTKLQNQIKEINQSKEDSKTKAEKIKDINQQVEAIEQQIQTAKIQEQEEKTQEAIAKNAEKEAEKQQEQDNANGTNGSVILSGKLAQIVSMKQKSMDLNTLNKVRTKIEGEINVANAEVKSDAALHGSTTYKIQQISNDSEQLTQINQKIKNTLDVEKAVEKGTEKGLKKASAKGTKDDSNPCSQQTALSKTPGQDDTLKDPSKKLQLPPSIDIIV